LSTLALAFHHQGRAGARGFGRRHLRALRLGRAQRRGRWHRRRVAPDPVEADAAAAGGQGRRGTLAQRGDPLVERAGEIDAVAAFQRAPAAIRGEVGQDASQLLALARAQPLGGVGVAVERAPHDRFERLAAPAKVRQRGPVGQRRRAQPGQIAPDAGEIRREPRREARALDDVEDRVCQGRVGRGAQGFQAAIGGEGAVEDLGGGVPDRRAVDGQVLGAGRPVRHLWRQIDGAPVGVGAALGRFAALGRHQRAVGQPGDEEGQRALDRAEGEGRPGCFLRCGAGLPFAPAEPPCRPCLFAHRVGVLSSMAVPVSH
jgi:hypothetical protein